jgi:N-acyl-D-amino-acid deacylase
MFDYVLKGGQVIDPKNKISSRLNIGIKNGKINDLTLDDIFGKRVIDCSNLIISPGFVDVHMHEDPYDENKKDFQICISECMLKMGVTSVIGGNCGSGPQNPLEYLKAIERLGYPVNMGLLSAHANLREYVGDFDKYNNVDKGTIDQMCERLKEELQGATLGLSFGIRYTPGINREELLALSQVVKKYDKVVAAHVRDDAEGVIPAIMELIGIAQETGVKIQISHIGSMAAYGQMEEVYRLVDYYSGKGLDIGIDCYPYNAFCTSIGSTTFDDGFRERYKIDYSVLEITQGQYKGQRLCEQAFKKERKENPDYLVVAHVMREQEVDMALAHPKTVLASDGVLNDGSGHPRAAGAFPRFIREYVINKKAVSLFDAIAKMTYQPAARFGLKKGSLSIGSDADIVVFDLERIRDKATFEKPTEDPEGIKFVFVNGELALDDGKIINNRLGRSITIN